MADHDNKLLSPTVIKVLNEYQVALHDDANIGGEAADRLNALLRTGKVPKVEEIDTALFPLDKGESP